MKKPESLFRGLRKPALPRHGAALAARVALVSFLGWALQAQGAGFALFEHSAKNMGRAYAGGASNAGRDPATLFWNPAGMTLVPGLQAQAGAIAFTFTSEFTNSGSTQTLLTPAGPVTVPSSGREDDGGTDAVVPHFYLTSQLSGRLSLGIGLFSPFGLKTEYASDWVGRYHALKSELTNININPSLAYRLSDRLSVGAGISASYLDSKLTRAVFLADPASGAQLPDAHVKLKGDDWSYGFNLGLLYELDTDTRLGLAYRSRIDHTLEGHSTLSGAGPFSGSAGIRTNLTLPENLMLSGHLRLNDRWALMADIIWTRWSRFDELRIRFDDGTPDDVAVQDWEDSWRYTLGAEYRHNADWTLSAGIALDRSPIPNAQRRTPRIPGADRRWITLGASYRATDSVSIDFSYAHLFVSEGAVDNTIDLAPTTAPGIFTDRLVGTFDSSVDAVGIGVTIAF
jgi:long-chain fatty acid transport protein